MQILSFVSEYFLLPIDNLYYKALFVKHFDTVTTIKDRKYYMYTCICIYIYINIYIYVCVCVCVYVYIIIHVIYMIHIKIYSTFIYVIYSIN